MEGDGDRVRETLAMLAELQDLDDKLRDLRESKKGLDALRARNDEELAVFDGMLGQQSERIEEAREFCREKAKELEDKRDDMRRSRGRLNGITSQRELTAVNKELDIARRAIQQNTEEMGKLEVELEQAQADFDAKTTQRQEVEEAMGAAVESQRGGISELEAHAGEFNARRAQIRELLKRPLVGRYDRISRGRDGQAVASADTGKCAGCNMQVPPQVLNKCQRLETLESCQHCQRLLVYRSALTGEVPEASSPEA